MLCTNGISEGISGATLVLQGIARHAPGAISDPALPSDTIEALLDALLHSEAEEGRSIVALLHGQHSFHPSLVDQMMIVLRKGLFQRERTVQTAACHALVYWLRQGTRRDCCTVTEANGPVV